MRAGSIPHQHRRQGSNKEKQEEYWKLNEAAFSKILKEVDQHDDEERAFANTLEQGLAGKPMNLMQVPMLKRQAAKFHLRHDALRVKAKVESEEVKQNMFRANGGGQWKLHKALSSSNSSPRLALTRTRKGPKGQPKGTITTSPKEIDGIIQEVYGEIYKGDVVNKKNKR